MSGKDSFETHLIVAAVAALLALVAMVTAATIVNVANAHRDRAVQVACVQAGSTWVHGVCVARGSRGA